MHFKSGAKLCIPSSIKIINILLLFWGRLGRQVSTDNCALLLKYPSLKGIFYVVMSKTNMNLEYLYFIASALKVDQHNSEKTVNFGFKFWP